VKELVYISAPFSRARESEKFSMLLRSETMDFSSAALAAIALTLQSFCAISSARSFSASVLCLPGSERTNCLSGAVVPVVAHAERTDRRKGAIERNTVILSQIENMIHLIARFRAGGPAKLAAKVSYCFLYGCVLHTHCRAGLDRSIPASKLALQNQNTAQAG
jgi:hypothetical protein